MAPAATGTQQARPGSAWDAIIVGAGPAGTNTARLLAEQGHDVLVLEEHAEVGMPVQCAGLVTPRIFDHVSFDAREAGIHQNDLRGGIVVSPDGTRIRFETEKVQAIAMDRAGFDQACAHAAVEAGATLQTTTKAVAACLTPSDDGVIVIVQGADGGRSEERCRILIGADGIRGGVARWFHLPPVDEQVAAYEVELAGCNIPDGEEHLIPMFAGRAQAPGFFSWIIPVGGGRTRSGLAVAPGLSEAAAKRYYERMFDDEASAPYLRGSKEIYRIVGGIPLGMRKRLVTNRVALVGDAAGMAKPTSGGGILMALLASEHLARVAGDGLRRDKAGEASALDVGALRAYEREVKRSLGRELRFGGLVRRIFVRFHDTDLDRLAHLLSSPRARAAIERHGDIDYVSRLALPILWAQPRLIPLFAKIMLRPGGGRMRRRRRSSARKQPVSEQGVRST